jgi:hypothetical protein
MATSKRANIARLAHKRRPEGAPCSGPHKLGQKRSRLKSGSYQLNLLLNRFNKIGECVDADAGSRSNCFRGVSDDFTDGISA